MFQKSHTAPPSPMENSENALQRCSSLLNPEPHICLKSSYLFCNILLQTIDLIVVLRNSDLNPLPFPSCFLCPVQEPISVSSLLELNPCSTRQSVQPPYADGEHKRLKMQKTSFCCNLCQIQPCTTPFMSLHQKEENELELFTLPRVKWKAGGGASLIVQCRGKGKILFLSIMELWKSYITL